MSSPHRRLPPLPVRGASACMCSRGDDCSSFAAGHALHLIQARLASATPSGWVDSMVEAVDHASGDIVLRSIEHGERLHIWSAAGAAGALEPGEPVAVHSRYHVLAAGALRFNVLS